MQFDHEKLHVYKVSLEFVHCINELTGNMKGNHRHLIDQITRASLSIPLNIAEGNGKRSAMERKRFFEIARGSAMECAASLDMMVAVGSSTDEEIGPAKELLVRVVAMLSKMTDMRESVVREDEVEYGQGVLAEYENEYELRGR